MTSAYSALSAMSLIAPVAVCLWLIPAFLRFMLPKTLTLTWRHNKHDGLMAATFILMLNRAWLSSRHLWFGSRLEAMQPWELPYLNASLAWALIAIVFMVIMLHGYRKNGRHDRD